MNDMKIVRIGSGAGYSGDRIDPAVEIAEKGNIDYLVFECLAERTIALANQAKHKDPDAGYDQLLDQRMYGVLKYMQDQQGNKRFKIISNMGAANPLAAIKRIKEIIQDLGLDNLKVAAVLGDDVLKQLKGRNYILDNGLNVDELGEKVIAANAYLGIEGIVEALKQDADIIITGRVADPSLFLAPLVFEFGWSTDDWEKLGKGTAIGHLLECAGQVTGGYFADPGIKDVANLENLGFPIAIVQQDGEAIITKLDGTGGTVHPSTCKEQIIYELHDPHAYKTPDVTADFSHIQFNLQAENQVLVSGATGNTRPEMLKVTVGFLDGYIGEGQISYGGINSLNRAKLAQKIVLARLEKNKVQMLDIRADLLGINSLYGESAPEHIEPWEVRLRVAAHCQNKAQATEVANEVETLYTNGPYGGGGAVKSVKEVLAVGSLYLPRSEVNIQVVVENT